MSARFRQITAWVLLLAFCGMIGTKAFHHHHWTAAEDVVCPLDGVAMSHHTLAHTILQSLDDNCDNYCAICHFTAAKVVFPNCFHVSNTDYKLFLHHHKITYGIVQNLLGISLLRAPPVQ